MTQSYDARRSDLMIVFVAVTMVVITRCADNNKMLVSVLFLLCGVGVVFRLVPVALVLVVVCLISSMNSRHAMADLEDVTFGYYSGIAQIRADPRFVRAATQTVIEINGDRFVVYAYGQAGSRLARVSVGEQVIISGNRLALNSISQQRWISRHVKGQFNVESVENRILVAAPFYRSAQRIRQLVKSGVESIPYADQALFTGLVIGDDSDQSTQMISVFRKSGLAHLVAVSGQNVAFVLAGLSPLLSRVNPRWRIFLTIFILLWFVVITRIEPSVVRAAITAGVAAVAGFVGRPMQTLRLIALTVIITMLIDPLLAWSVGFFMSVGATTGLCVFASPLAKLIPGPRWLATSIGASVAAQLGIIPVVIFVFGLPPATGIIANILAVPVASLVMLVGLPLAIFVGILVPTALSDLGRLLIVPIHVGVRWVWWVAEIGAQISSTGLMNLGLWFVVLLGFVLLHHRSARV